MAAFSIRASKGEQSVVTVRIGPSVTIAKALALQQQGWNVEITDAEGHVFEPDNFEAGLGLSPAHQSKEPALRSKP